ncbi:protein export chaperone SatS [Mycolicibacter algericus]|uniref:Primosomal protein n=1 Tax=Mycolicibacter algericus DSM 45454 TaxID=723879 RepID=A0ABX3RRV5_MYCAL|nr:primosomal protein [Mycolicibacter algericus]OQZ96438.1 primosomal protein [Mycolicibacter algericus DSM 45454]
MAADLVPIRLAVTAGDRYTLWAPRWRDAGDEWEAFLGKDEDLYVFDTAADLVAFVRTNTDNDLTDHPAWPRLVEANAHKLNPPRSRQYDLIAVEELLADKPTKQSVRSVADALEIVSSIGTVCDLTAVTKFFNGNPSLGTLAGGVDNFSGRAGRKRWNQIGDIIGRSWSNVLAAVEGVISTPDVDAAASSRAADELAEEPPVEVTEAETEAAPADAETADATESTEAAVERARGDRVVLGGDADFWAKVGIDPIRIMTDNGTFFTLRCYLGDEPVFLGRNGRISVFNSERALARYLADEHDHDLSDLSTYDDIRTAATDGSLAIDITDDNVYVLSGMVDDLTDGPDAVDREQLELAVEFLQDVGSYAEDGVVAETLKPDRALGRMVGYVLDRESVAEPQRPFAPAVKEWEQLEQFVQSRLRRE